MNFVVLKEKDHKDCRVSMIPKTVALILKKDRKVFVETGAGIKSNYSDLDYKNSGAIIFDKDNYNQVLSQANIVLKINATSLNDELNELNFIKQGTVVIGMFSKILDVEYINLALKKKIIIISLMYMPRISRAQSMDVLSSQSNLIGYRSVIEAVHVSDLVFPMMITSAGTVGPVKILVIGTGVIGLQAIATAKRLGAVVSAYDVRASAKDQVISVGGNFVYPESFNGLNLETNSICDKDSQLKFFQIQKKFLLSLIKKFNIIICAAQIFGKQAPLLITRDMMCYMCSNSIILDLSVSTGGNVEGSRADQLVKYKEVKILSWSNILNKIPCESSNLYSKNIYNFLVYFLKYKKIDWNDLVLKSVIISFNS